MGLKNLIANNKISTGFLMGICLWVINEIFNSEIVLFISSFLMGALSLELEKLKSKTK